MYGGKKVCPNCGQPQEKNWDKCPFCIGMSGMGGAAMGGAPGFGAPPMGAAGYGGPPPGGAPQRTVALVAGGGVAGAASQLLGWLVPLKGPHKGELHTLKPQSVIGKDPTCDVVFNDAFMSGRHATIRQQGGVFVLEDHSTNGTFVNDKKIKTHELVDSDFVKFGQTLVKFKAL
jgi:hypothetical protein